METAWPTTILRIRDAGATTAEDWLAIERPLELRARTGAGGAERVVSTTMRTPGEDQALAAGFLFSERVISQARQIRWLEQVADDSILIELDADAEVALAATQRPFVTTGACGVCGRTTLDALLAIPEGAAGPERRLPQVAAAVIHGLPAGLKGAQATFTRTGGLHAAGLFTTSGAVRAVHEDVGRHNAVDKLVGTLLLAGELPARDAVLAVSGRASFELVQKAATAGLPVMAAVGAPSSLAVDIARRAGMTLLGFVRERGFNIYCGAERISGMESAAERESAASA
jgi:FdhD protein